MSKNHEIVVSVILWLNFFFCLIFFWSHLSSESIILLLFSLIILWFGRMVRIHQLYHLYVTLEYVKLMDFEELSQSLREILGHHCLFWTFIFFFFLLLFLGTLSQVSNNSFESIILAILSWILSQVSNNECNLIVLSW